MPDRRAAQGGGGNRVSPQTLVVASLASLTAAIVTSTFWRGGTPITAAITPVIVALASELYSRPARRITELSSRATERTRRLDPVEEVARERAAMGGSNWRPDEDDDRPPPIREPEPGSAPVRVYKTSGGGGGGGRRFNPKVALVTAAIAFAIAAIVLTVPELVFGGSVASHGQTTLFGGSSHKQKSSSDKKQTPTSSTPSQTTTTPSATTPTQTQQAPAQTAPQTTTPAPSGGGAPTPAPGGTVAPQSQTTPAPTP